MELKAYVSDWLDGVIPQFETWELLFDSVGKPFSNCFLPSGKISSEIFPRWNTKSPICAGWLLSSEKLSKTQNCMYSTFMIYDNVLNFIF